MLWFVAAAAGLAIAFVRLTTGDRYMAVTQIDAIRAKSLAQDGMAKTLLVLNARRTDRPLPRALRWSLPDGQVTVRVESEAAKVDLNAADRTLLAALARAVGIANAQASEIGDAIVDWRDEDKARQPNGAEAQEYGSADRDHGPADKPFRQLEELRYVLPVDNLAYSRMLPHLTIYSGRAQPERRQASPTVRAAMDLQRGLKPQGEPPGSEQDSAASRQPTRGMGSRAIPAPAGPTSTPQPGAAGGRAAAGAGAAGGGGAGEASGAGTVYTLRIDVRLAEGYESHTSTAVALAGEGGTRAIRILDWKPVLAAPTTP